MRSILVVDASPQLLESTRCILSDALVFPAGHDPANLQGLDESRFDLIVFEQTGSAAESLGIIANLRARCANVPLIVLLQPAFGQLAGEVLKCGASDWLLHTAELASSLPAVLQRNLAVSNLQRELQAARAECGRLSAAGTSKQHFLRRLDHDLRTPLLTIRSYAQLLAQARLGELNNAQKEKLEIILRNTDRLARTIDQIRCYERLERDETQLVRAAFDLKELVSEIISGISVRCLEKGVALGQSWPLESVSVYADRELIGEVLRELLENAIHYTPERGSILVAITERDTEVVISVTDTGEQIPPEMLKQVYEPGHTIATEELGLCLPAAKRLLEKHASKLEIDSQAGQGTRARFKLPLCGRSWPQPITPARERRRDTILVVDDDDDNLACTRAILELAGYAVLGASSFQEAREQLQQNHVDAVLLDIAMKERDGFETLRVLKRFPATSSIPVIMISGYGEDQMRVDAARLGAHAFLVKPFSSMKLLRELQNAISPQLAC